MLTNSGKWRIIKEIKRFSGGIIMFDEKSSVWLNIYKGVVAIGTIACAILGLVWCIVLADWSGTDQYAIWALLGGIFLAFVNQASGMLIANVIGNIQRIRECSEKLANMPSVTTSNETDELPEI